MQRPTEEKILERRIIEIHEKESGLNLLAIKELWQLPPDPGEEDDEGEYEHSIYMGVENDREQLEKFIKSEAQVLPDYFVDAYGVPMETGLEKKLYSRAAMFEIEQRVPRSQFL